MPYLIMQYKEGSASFHHQQTVASSTWVVQHDLEYYPIVRVYTNSNDEIQPLSVVHDSTTQVTITFSSSRTGTARFL